MAGAAPITLDAHETGILQKILRSRTLGKNLLAKREVVELKAEISFGFPSLGLRDGVSKSKSLTVKIVFFEHF